jgi:hypothetical protein
MTALPLKTATTATTFEVSKGQNCKSKKWICETWSLADLADKLTKHERRNVKDGTAIVPGAMQGTERRLAAISSLSMFIVDFDGEATLDEIREKLECGTYQAYLYSSFNHRSTESRVLTTMYGKFAKEPAARRSRLAKRTCRRTSFGSARSCTE